MTTTLVQYVTIASRSILADAASSLETSSASTSASIATSASLFAVTTDLASRLRRSGTPATEEQIQAACADVENIVLNPNFGMQDDGTLLGWSIDTHDPSITLDSEPAPTGNGTIARFKSAVVGRRLTITQPVTLCPGQQYELSALTRQAHVEAGCTVEYTIGNDTVISTTPQQIWLKEDSFFTAQPGVAGASADIKITANCKGFSGFPVADDEGWMRVEVSGVSIVKGKDNSKVKKRDATVVSTTEVEKQGYAALVWE